MDKFLIFFIAAIVFMFCLFFILRMVVLWYFKIDKRTELMEQQLQKLSKIAELLEKQNRI